MNKTIDYYNTNADNYYESTAGVDFRQARSKFLSYLPEGAQIIDIGCGSGRDVKAFCDMGYHAVGLDASSGLAEVARQRMGIQVQVGDMSTWIASEPFDGIWCCASLLHLQDEEADRFFQNLRRNLAPGGVIYISVKEGIQTGPDEKGRFMRNYTEDELRSKLETVGLTVLDVDRTGDLLGRARFCWLNVIASR